MTCEIEPSVTPYTLPWRMNAVLIMPNASPALSLFDVVKRCRAVYVPIHLGLSIFHHHIESHIGSDRVGRISDLYDRDPSALDWYFEMYSSECGLGTKNHIIQSVIGHTKSSVTGHILLVQNGVEGGSWTHVNRSNVDVVSRTLWWYMCSGSNAASVAAERHLVAYFQSM